MVAIESGNVPGDGWFQHRARAGAGRLRAVGWQPSVTNEQAYVEGTEAKWWTMVSPKRRQEIALGGLGAVLVLIAVVVVRGLRRARARRR
jgi:hypothetical protein